MKRNGKNSVHVKWDYPLHSATREKRCNGFSHGWLFCNIQHLHMLQQQNMNQDDKHDDLMEPIQYHIMEQTRAHGSFTLILLRSHSCINATMLCELPRSEKIRSTDTHLHRHAHTHTHAHIYSSYMMLLHRHVDRLLMAWSRILLFSLPLHCLSLSTR